MVAFIFVLYKTPKSEIERLKREVSLLGFKNYKIYFIDNTKNNRGYAGGVNLGIKKGLKDEAKIFIVANVDVSLKQLSRKDFIDLSNSFDIGGFAMEQEKKLFYGGKIDRWRMSGGLITEKPKKRYQETDFVSGSLMVINKKVIDKLGFFDESYFLYYEEVDYCFRGKKAGLKIGIDSRKKYRHFEISKKENKFKKYFLAKNRLKFFLKFANSKQRVREFFRSPKTFIEELSTILLHLVKNEFLVNFFSLNFSALLNKSFHFILFIFLIRNFSVASYGKYVLSWTQIGLLLPLLDFGTTSYGLVYLGNKKEKHFSSLFSLRIFLAGVVFLVTNLLALVFHFSNEMLLYIFLTSFVIFSNSLSGSYLIITSVKRNVYKASIASTVFNFLLVFGTIISILFYNHLIILFLIIFIFYNLYSLANLLLIKKEIGKIVFRFEFSYWKKIARKSAVFLVIGLLAGLYFKLDIYLLNFFKGSEAVGIYSSGYKFLTALMIVVSSYNVSSLPILSSLYKKSKRAFLKKIKLDLLLVNLVGVAIVGGFYLFSPLLKGLVFTQKYIAGLVVAKIVIFSLPLVLTTSVFLNSLYAMKKASLAIYLFSFQVFLNFFLNIVYIPRYSYLAASYTTLGGEIINTFLTGFILFYLLKKDENFS